MILNKQKTYSFKDFFENEYNKDTKSKHILDKDKLVYALFCMNPNTSPGVNHTYINPQRNIMDNSLDNLANAVDGVGGVLHYLSNPMEVLKNLAQVCIDLSFSTTAIVSIVALCMYVFTGCKDRKPLQYVGLSVACMYVISVIFSAFITTV